MVSGISESDFSSDCVSIRFEWICTFPEHGGHHGHSHGLAHSNNKLAQLANTDDNENNSFMFNNEPEPPAKKSHGHSHNAAHMNMRGAFLHVLSDALGSIIVIISALVNLDFYFEFPFECWI